MDHVALNNSTRPSIGDGSGLTGRWTKGRHLVLTTIVLSRLEKAQEETCRWDWRQCRAFHSTAPVPSWLPPSSPLEWSALRDWCPAVWSCSCGWGTNIERSKKRFCGKLISKLSENKQTFPKNLTWFLIPFAFTWALPWRSFLSLVDNGRCRWRKFPLLPLPFLHVRHRWPSIPTKGSASQAWWSQRLREKRMHDDHVKCTIHSTREWRRSLTISIWYFYSFVT